MTGAWILTVGTGAVLAIPLAGRALRRRFDPFEPITLFALAYGVMFVVRPIVLLANGPSDFFGVGIADTLPIAVLLAQVGAVAFVVAYELAAEVAARPRRRPSRQTDTAALVTTALVVAAIGLAAFLLLLPLSDPREALEVVTGGRGEALDAVLDESSTYLWYGSWLLAPASLLLVGVAVRCRSWSLAALAAVVLALTLVRTIPLGSRIVLLPLVGGIAVLVYVMRGKRPSLLTLTGIAVATVVLSYAMLVIREPTERSGLVAHVERIVERPSVLVRPILYGPDAEMVEALSGALTAVPDRLGYRYGGATVGDLVTRPVPRELWSGKPLPAREQVVKEVWPDAYPYLNPAFSPLLSFFWDLGLAGVALGMALFGLGARTLYGWFQARSDGFAAQLVFAATVWFVVIGARNDIVDTIIFASFLVAPVIAAVAVSGDEGRLARRLGRSRGRAAPLAGPDEPLRDAVRR